MKTRVVAAVLAVALGLVTVTGVIAWTSPVLEPACAPTQNQFAWDITLTAEEDHLLELHWDASFGPPVYDTISFASGAGTYHFFTQRDGTTLWVRYVSDHEAVGHALAEEKLCTPTPTPTSTQTGEPTSTPTPTPRRDPTPTVTATSTTPSNFTLPPTATNEPVQPPNISNGMKILAVLLGICLLALWIIFRRTDRENS